jgi:hypothetical protein
MCLQAILKVPTKLIQANLKVTQTKSVGSFRSALKQKWRQLLRSVGNYFFRHHLV